MLMILDVSRQNFTLSYTMPRVPSLTCEGRSVAMWSRCRDPDVPDTSNTSYIVLSLFVLHVEADRLPCGACAGMLMVLILLALHTSSCLCL